MRMPLVLMDTQHTCILTMDTQIYIGDKMSQKHTQERVWEKKQGEINLKTKSDADRMSEPRTARQQQWNQCGEGSAELKDSEE